MNYREDDSEENRRLIQLFKLTTAENNFAILQARATGSIKCKVCGCTDLTPCSYTIQGVRQDCFWVTADLCSAPACIRADLKATRAQLRESLQEIVARVDPHPTRR